MEGTNLTGSTGDFPLFLPGQERSEQSALTPGIAEDRSYPTACREYIKGCQNSPIRMLKRIDPSSSGPWKKLILRICNLICGKTNVDQNQICRIEGNKQLIRTAQTTSSSVEGITGGLPFDTNDVQDAITIAAIKSRPPDTRETPRHVLIGGQSISDRIPADDQVKVTSFINNLRESGMFYFKDGVIETKSGLRVSVTHNTETHKICIYYYGTKFSLQGRGKQTLHADLQIATGGVHKMCCEAVILAKCAADAFGSDKTLLTGHSLGGSLCQFASASLKIPGISLNPAAINENLLLGLPTDHLLYAKNNGLQISVKGDIVSDKLFAGRKQGRCVQLFGNKVVLPHNGGGNAHMQSTIKAAFSAVASQPATGPYPQPMA
ncbi:MAG: hypothetical protein LBI47_02515 [Puniceicoccales bacterium]|jgi:hypothetical protein|nr:hypothetical protein [Puniceicoccales bacterium]